MLDAPVYAWDDLEGIAPLVRDHPWAVVVSVADGQPVVSHTGTDPVHGQPELADTMRAHVPHLFVVGRA